jgi:hypothetical protein
MKEQSFHTQKKLGDSTSLTTILSGCFTPSTKSHYLYGGTKCFATFENRDTLTGPASGLAYLAVFLN